MFLFTWTCKNIVYEHFMVLYDVFVASAGLNNNTEYYKLKSTGSDLKRSRLTDTDPQKMTGSEPIPILSIGSMHPYNSPLF